MKTPRIAILGVALACGLGLAAPAQARAINEDNCDSRNVIVYAWQSRCYAWAGGMSVYIPNTTGLHAGINSGRLTFASGFGISFTRGYDYNWTPRQTATYIRIS
jgi:hypothetical protein